MLGGRSSHKSRPADRPAAEEGRPLVSVVVCTYSRVRMEQMLATLRSLEEQTYSPREVILVVDNNPELAAELRSTLDSARVIENAGPKGLSGARNTGVREARGEIVAFIDDDATARPAWIEGLVAEYAHDGILGVGGGVVPAWDGGRKPSWLPEEFLWVVGCSYRGLPEGGAIRNPIGCNMSFRPAVFDRVGGFDPLVGRIGLAPTGCEETELCIRALNHWPNAKIVYVPQAEVLHYVPRSRQTIGYFLSRCFSEGKSKAAVSKLAGVKSLGEEREYIFTLGAGALRNLRDALLLKDVSGGLSRAGATVAGAAAVGGGFLIANARLRLGLVSGQGRATRDQVRERDFRLVLASLVLTAISGLLIAAGLIFSSLKLNDYGLVRSFPVTFYLGLALLPVASSPLWFTRSKVHIMVVGQLALLLIALSLSPYIVESTVRFRSAYKNFGDVDWLISGAGLDPKEVIYHNWPLFPGLMAGLVKTTGLEATTLMGIFPFLINLAYMVPLVILVRQFAGNDNRWWAGVWFFYLFNWTGQNYFSPQAFAFLLFLALLAVLAHVAMRREGNFGGPLAAAVLLLYGAIVLTHLLTGILALVTLAVLHVARRLKQPSLLVAAAVIFLAWQSYGAFSYFEMNHERNLSNLLNPEGFILFNVQDRLKGAEGHVVVGRLRTLSALAAFLTASAGLLVWLRELTSQQNGRWKLYRTFEARTFEARTFEASSGPRSVLASIASNRPLAFAVPILFGLAATGPIFVYGGEMLIRIMLFSLPALCVLFLLTVSWRATLLPAVAVLAVAAPLHIVTYYGNELYDYISPKEVEGFEFVRTQLAPANIIGGYPAGAFRNTPELEWRAAVGAGESELPSPSVYLDPEGYSWRRPEWPAYAVVGRGDGAAAHLFYDEQGFIEASRSALDATCNFTLVFDNGDIAIYRWRPECGSGRSPVFRLGGVGFLP